MHVASRASLAKVLGSMQGVVLELYPKVMGTQEGFMLESE